MRDKALRVAAHVLEAADDDLEIDDGAIRVKGVPDLKVGLGEIAKAVAGAPGYALPGGIAPGMEANQTVLIDALTYANGTACRRGRGRYRDRSMSGS